MKPPSSADLQSPPLSAAVPQGPGASIPDPDASQPRPGLPEVLDYFNGMVDRCYDYAEAARARGRPLVGIMCEFTPREIILAAGAVPVCLCGGSAATIPDAERLLPSNLCPLIKSTFGYHVQGSNPFLRWADLVVAETTCDGKKKMFELLGATKPIYVLELPHKADDPDAHARWTHELVKFKAFLEERFHTRITDQGLREAIHTMNRERQLRRYLAESSVLDPPPLTGRQLLELHSLISGIEEDLQQYQHALADIVERGRQSDAAGSLRSRGHSKVRILLTGVPVVHGAERVVELIEAAGAVVVVMENCTGLKPILEDVDEAEPDPIAALAQKYYHLPCSVLTPNQRRLEMLRGLATKYRPQGVIELVWQACLTYDVESCQVRKLAEEEWRLPYLKISTDYSPSDSARITARVEALVETIQAASPS